MDMPSPNPTIDLIMPTRAGWYVMLRPIAAQKRRAQKKGKKFAAVFTMTCGSVWSDIASDKEVVIGPDETRRIIHALRLALSRYDLEFDGFRPVGSQVKPGSQDVRTILSEFEVKVR
jgi:hypothetical protein